METTQGKLRAVPVEGLQVRRAQPADLERICQLNRALALETEGLTLEPERLRNGVLATFENRDRGFYRVAELGGRVVGCCMVTSEWSDWRNGFFWWIQSVYVEPAQRGKGVYRALHDGVLAEARRDRGVCGIRLYVERTNTNAQRVYTALGMSPSHYQMYELELSERVAHD